MCINDICQLSFTHLTYSYPPIQHQILSQDHMTKNKIYDCTTTRPLKIYLTSSLLEVTVSKVAQEILLLGVGLLSGERKSFDNKKEPISNFHINLVGLCSTPISLGEGGCLPTSPSSSVLYGISPG